MAMTNPVGRVNYEPNSWTGADRGPREDPAGGFTTFPAVEQGTKERVRSDRFADHYSQARQFFVSQTPVEQAHIVDAFVFELSKCEEVGIRTRMVANLRNVDDDFARRIADGLGLDELPDAAPAAREPVADLPPSDALSIARNGPESFAGRKIGLLVTDGTDATMLKALRKAATDEGATVELVAPKIGGVVTSDGQRTPAQQQIDGGPSVLYDAVAVLASAEGAAALSDDASTKDFITDAHAHCKYIGYAPSARPLLEAAGVAEKLDDGYFALDGRSAIKPFIAACRTLRHWERTPGVDQT